jgi:phosphoadenosine phosphosulfate reductase
MNGAMRPSYLGRILLRWCDHCHVPVLAERCQCGGATRDVPVTPPGDARPAFEADIDLVNTIYSDHFGAPLVPLGHIALLNKVPDKDRMEEVIIGGGIAGAIRYIPKEYRWEPIPRPEAGLLLIPKKRFVEVDDGAVAPIRNTGASVLAPGLVFIDDAVQCGDEVLIMDKNRTCIGAGRARVDAAPARTMKHGVIIKTRKNIPSIIVTGPASWDAAVRANTSVIERAESAAVGFVQEITRSTGLQRNVSYSGGKDSLATLLVVTKALGKTPLLFADTGFEFPETYENIDAVSQHYGVNVVRTDGQTRFQELFDRHGPPAVNARWCCKACKLDPVQHLIREQWGECLSFIGQRKYESMRRARSKRVWKNPNVPAQTCAAPIHNWTALHVWLYLMREHAPHNVLYERRLDRIGCFMCPSSDMALIRIVESEYPALWNGWRDRLCAWQKTHRLPENWVHDGGWRLKGEDCGLEEDSDC